MHMRITRLFDGVDGRSQFSDDTLTLRAAPGNGASTSTTLAEELLTTIPVAELRFLQLQPGWSREASPAPDERYLIVLNGVLDIEAGDGDMRRFGPGAVLLVTDTSGEGHRARVVGGPVLLAIAPLPSNTTAASDGNDEQDPA